jgi:nucleoid-associated protein EbfC
MKDLNDILGMATKMQEELQKAQADMDKVQVEGVAGGGLVRITASAKGRVMRIAIDDSLMVPEDKTMLEDLIVAAFNDARVKADEAAGQHMGKITSGLSLPPGFKLPF